MDNGKQGLPLVSHRTYLSRQGRSTSCFVERQKVVASFDDPYQSTSVDIVKGEVLDPDESLENEEVVVKDLLTLENGWGEANMTYLFKTFMSFVTPSFLLGFASCGYDLLNLLGFFISAQSNNQEGEGAFGLALFYNTILVFGIFYAVDEKVGVAAAVFAGAKKPRQAMTTVWQGFFLLILINVFYFLPLMYFAPTIFISIGFGEAQAIESSRIMRQLYPLDVVRMFNDIIMTYILALGTPNHFGQISALNLALSFVSGLVAYYRYDMGLHSWWIARAARSYHLRHADDILHQRRRRQIQANHHVQRSHEWLRRLRQRLHRIFGRSLY